MEQVQQNKSLNVSDASAFLRLKKPTPDEHMPKLSQT
jgi:hypothetical protein